MARFGWSPVAQSGSGSMSAICDAIGVRDCVAMMISGQSLVLEVVRGVIEDEVGVAPAEAKRVDRDTTSPLLRPRDTLNWYLVSLPRG